MSTTRLGILGQPRCDDDDSSHVAAVEWLSLNAPESSAAPEDNSADDYVLSMNMGGVLEEQTGALESTATSGAGTLAA